MQKKIQIQVDPLTAANENLIKAEIEQIIALSEGNTFAIKILRRSVDARRSRIKINLTVLVSVNEQIADRKIDPNYPDVSQSKKICHIIGAGPAGLFAALRCIELGIKPILIERGKDVKARRRDLAAINKDHVINPESNYCFGNRKSVV